MHFSPDSCMRSTHHSECAQPASRKQTHRYRMRPSWYQHAMSLKYHVPAEQVQPHIRIPAPYCTGLRRRRQQQQQPPQPPLQQHSFPKCRHCTAVDGCRMYGPPRQSRDAAPEPPTMMWQTVGTPIRSPKKLAVTVPQPQSYTRHVSTSPKQHCRPLGRQPDHPLATGCIALQQLEFRCLLLTDGLQPQGSATTHRPPVALVLQARAAWGLRMPSTHLRSKSTLGPTSGNRTERDPPAQRFRGPFLRSFRVRSSDKLRRPAGVTGHQPRMWSWVRGAHPDRKAFSPSSPTR
jgi:hypothetical protein